MRAQTVTYVIQAAVNVNVLKQTGMNIHVFYKYIILFLIFYVHYLIAKKIRLNLIFCF